MTAHFAWSVLIASAFLGVFSGPQDLRADTWIFCTAHNDQEYIQSGHSIRVSEPNIVDTDVLTKWRAFILREQSITPPQLVHGDLANAEFKCYGYPSVEALGPAYDQRYKVGRDRYRYGEIEEWVYAEPEKQRSETIPSKKVSAATPSRSADPNRSVPKSSIQPPGVEAAVSNSKQEFDRATSSDDAALHGSQIHQASTNYGPDLDGDWKVVEPCSLDCGRVYRVHRSGKDLTFKLIKAEPSYDLPLEMGNEEFTWTGTDFMRRFRVNKSSWVKRCNPDNMPDEISQIIITDNPEQLTWVSTLRDNYDCKLSDPVREMMTRQ